MRNNGAGGVADMTRAFFVSTFRALSPHAHPAQMVWSNVLADTGD